MNQSEESLVMTPSNKLCDPNVETNSDAMFFQLGFSHNIDNYKQNWENCGSWSQESLDSLRKLIYEIDSHYGINSILKEFDEWFKTQ